MSIIKFALSFVLIWAVVTSLMYLAKRLFSLNKEKKKYFLKSVIVGAISATIASVLLLFIIQIF